MVTIPTGFSGFSFDLHDPIWVARNRPKEKPGGGRLSIGHELWLTPAQGEIAAVAGDDNGDEIAVAVLSLGEALIAEDNGRVVVAQGVFTLAFVGASANP